MQNVCIDVLPTAPDTLSSEDFTEKRREPEKEYPILIYSSQNPIPSYQNFTELKELFNNLSEGRSSISKQQFCAALYSNGFENSRSIDNLFDFVDISRDGVIDLHEFLRLTAPKVLQNRKITQTKLIESLFADMKKTKAENEARFKAELREAKQKACCFSWFIGICLTLAIISTTLGIVLPLALKISVLFYILAGAGAFVMLFGCGCACYLSAHTHTIPNDKTICVKGTELVCKKVEKFREPIVKQPSTWHVENYHLRYTYSTERYETSYTETREVEDGRDENDFPKYKTERREVTEYREREYKHTHRHSTSRHTVPGIVTFKDCSKQFIPQSKTYRTHMSFESGFCAQRSYAEGFRNWARKHRSDEEQDSRQHFSQVKSVPAKFTAEWVPGSYPTENQFWDLRTGLVLEKDDVRRMNWRGKGFYVKDDSRELRVVGKQRYIYQYYGIKWETLETVSDYSKEYTHSRREIDDRLISEIKSSWR